MFNLKFLRKLGEDAATSFVVAFAGMVAVTDVSITGSLLAAAAVAGVKSVAGVLVKNVGSQDSPRVF